MLELIMVIAIISILMLVIRSAFQNRDRDILYAESCVNKVYWDVNNFVYSAMTSRGLYISWNTIYPDEYNIDMNISTNNILLRYKTQTWTWVYINNILSGDLLKTSYCSNSNYKITLSWSNLSVKINKSSLQDQNLPIFTLSWWTSLFTWQVKLLLCYIGTNCKELAAIVMDLRTQKAEKKKCLTLTSTWSCQAWDK